jgi:signal transduction histidine kinase
VNRTIILVLEDLAEVVVQGLLEDTNCDVHIACSSTEVIEQAKVHTPDAVVVDLLLEDIDGLAVCRTLRRHPLTSAVPIIAVIAPGDTAARTLALEAGANQCLTRPLDGDEMLGLVGALSDRTTPGTLQALNDLPPTDADGIIRILEHDLKSPSNDIVSGMGLLTEAPEVCITPAGEKILHSALAAAHRQLRLINELLYIARLENGTLTPVVEAVDVADLLREVIDEIGAVLMRKGLQVDDLVPAGLPPIAAAPELLRGVFHSLLENSMKFCVRDSKVIIDAQADEGCVTLTFTDNGRPVTDEYTDSIFDIRVQWRARQAGSRTSVALGLPFCRAALRAMQGDIHVRSTGGERNPRTTFTVMLPSYQQQVGF